MFGHSRRNRSGQHVDPDLPITPMLDMSFQLLAFFIFTFRPAPTEGQILLALPKDEGAKDQVTIPSPTDDKPVNFIVRVASATNGTIAGMTIHEQGDPNIKPTELGADPKTYQAALKVWSNVPLDCGEPLSNELSVAVTVCELTPAQVQWTVSPTLIVTDAGM